MATVRSLAGWGVKVQLQDLFVVHTRPSCLHDEAEGKNFCPECGMKVRKMGKHTIPGLNLDNGEFVNGLTVVDLSDGHDTGDVFIGHFHAISSDGGRVKAVLNPSVEELEKEEAFDALPSSVETFNTFGFWHIIY